MNRRDLLKMIAATTGTAMVGGSALLSGCARVVAEPELSFSGADLALLDEMAETIIPRTDTPGAKDAQVGQLMTVMVRDTYTEEEQKIFHSGLPKINAASQQAFGEPFIALTPEQRHSLVSALDAEAKQYNLDHADRHYFTMIKQLTLFGFFTSEIAAKNVLRYMAIPGHYDPCLPYEEGDRAWAT